MAAQRNAKSTKSSKASKSPFWARVAHLLDRSRRKRMGLNLSRLTRLTQSGQTVVVAERVLGTGAMAHPITIAAMGYSQSARRAIEKSGGKIVTLADLQVKNPTGKDVAILI